MQAHNEVMRGICQRTIKLIEALSELPTNGGNGSNETDGAEHHD